MKDDILKNTLAEALSFMEDKNLQKKFLLENYMPYWEKAFTHESINVKENYEKYEFIGDITMGYGFKKYLFEDLQINNFGIVNNLSNYYLSEKYQPIIAKKLRLDHLVRHHHDIKLDEKMLEDITEAFFGVLTMIARKLWKHDPYKYPHPTLYGQNFYRWYFQKMDKLDLHHTRLIDKTFFGHLYYFFSNDSTQTNSSAIYNQKTSTLRLSPIFFQQVGFYSPELEKKLLLLPMKGELEAIHREIVLLFEEEGFTNEWLKEEQRRVQFKDDYPSLPTLAKENGLTRFILRRNKFSSYDLLAQTVDSFSRKSITYKIKSFSIPEIDDIKKQSFELLQKIDLKKMITSTHIE